MGWVYNATPEVEAISQWPLIVSVSIILSFFSVAVVSLRLWVRFKARGLAADDHFAALAMVFGFAYSVLCIVQTRYGLGLVPKLRPMENLVTYTVVNFAGRPIYQMGISFFKIALLISYLRLFKGTNQSLYVRIVWGTIAAVFLGHVACTFCLIFACDPIHKSWDPNVDGTCLPPGPSFTGYAAVTIASDIVVAILPLPVLWSLNVSQKKKLGLAGVFLLGLFTTLCSILRYVQINRIQFGDGNSTMLVLWGVIEFNVGNMVSSLPFLAPVFVKKARDYRSKHSQGYENDSSGRGRSHKLGGSGRQHYKLSSLSRGDDSQGSKGGSFTPTTNRSNSEENILKDMNDQSIIKSVTYSVRVDEGNAMKKEGGIPI